MTVYVDPLHDYDWILHGKPTPSCHLFTDEIDLISLHALAAEIGMRREWFQDKAAGAVPVDRRTAAVIWRARRALVGSAPSSRPQLLKNER